MSRRVRRGDGRGEGSAGGTFEKYLHTFSDAAPTSWLKGQALPAWQLPLAEELARDVGCVCGARRQRGQRGGGARAGRRNGRESGGRRRCGRARTGRAPRPVEASGGAGNGGSSSDGRHDAIGRAAVLVLWYVEAAAPHVARFWQIGRRHGAVGGRASRAAAAAALSEDNARSARGGRLCRRRRRRRAEERGGGRGAEGVVADEVEVDSSRCRRGLGAAVAEARRRRRLADAGAVAGDGSSSGSRHGAGGWDGGRRIMSHRMENRERANVDETRRGPKPGGGGERGGGSGGLLIRRGDRRPASASGR